VRDERRLRVFENRGMRRIFGPKRDEGPGGWRKLQNEELNDLSSSPKYFSGNQIQKNEMGRARGTYGERTGLYRVLVGKPKRNRPLGRPRRRWENTNKMDLQEVGFGGMDWIDLAQDEDRWWTLVNEVMNFRVP
jgi:hypothetical protein